MSARRNTKELRAALMAGSNKSAPQFLVGSSTKKPSLLGDVGRSMKTSPWFTAVLGVVLGISSLVTGGPGMPHAAVAQTAAPAVRDGRIAFIRCAELCGAPGSRPDIYTMASDGSRIVRLTRTRQWERSPDWSPSGRRLVFGCEGTRSGSGHLCKMRADGSRVSDVTGEGFEDGSPDWGPDGRIVFIRVKDEPTQIGVYQLVTVAPNGEDEQVLLEDVNRISDPRWSPDGREIAYALSDAVQSDIHVISADGAETRNLTNSRAFETDPAWSPDGTRIAFSRYVDSRSRWELFTMDPSGGRETSLLTDGGGLGAEWSPSGKKLMFTRLTNNIHPLFAFVLGRERTHRLTRRYDAAAPSWKAKSG